MIIIKKPDELKVNDIVKVIAVYTYDAAYTTGMELLYNKKTHIIETDNTDYFKLNNNNSYWRDFWFPYLSFEYIGDIKWNKLEINKYYYVLKNYSNYMLNSNYMLKYTETSIPLCKCDLLYKIVKVIDLLEIRPEFNEMLAVVLYKKQNGEECVSSIPHTALYNFQPIYNGRNKKIYEFNEWKHKKYN